MAVELTDEEIYKIQDEAMKYARKYIRSDHFDLIYDLKRENLKKDLIISKLTK
jgi:hypothetical protein